MRKKASGFVLITLLVLLIIFFAIISIQNRTSKDKCEQYCDQFNALDSLTIHNNKMFSTNDLCVCFWENKILAFRMT